MTRYVDSFLVPVPKEEFKEYKALAALCATIWRDHGAIDYFESICDDVPMGNINAVEQSIRLKADELLVHTCISYCDKAQRDKINELAFADPRLANFQATCSQPFIARRMFWGGFQSFVE